MVTRDKYSILALLLLLIAEVATIVAIRSSISFWLWIVAGVAAFAILIVSVIGNSNGFDFRPKSGVASKKHLLVGANTVDIGYSGECHVNLHNVSDREQIINAGDKIVQGIMIKIGFHVPEEMKDENELYGDEKSARGEGGFGSSGTK